MTGRAGRAGLAASVRAGAPRGDVPRLSPLARRAGRANAFEVRVEVDPRTEAALEDALLGAAALLTGRTGDRLLLCGPREAFAALAIGSPWLAPLLEAVDASARAPRPPALMGVLNVTPDSFSDGGRFLGAAGRADPAAVVDAALAMMEAGARWLDVGAESTRPGAREVSRSEELARLEPVLDALAEAGLASRVSIDTRKGAVAALALERGAGMVNDVSGGTHDPALLEVVAKWDAQLVLMHMRGTPRTMQRTPRYDDVVFEVARELRERRRRALDAGVRPERIWLDPGIGFGKTAEHNIELIARLPELRSLGAPLCVGVSRKAFVGALTDVAEPRERRFGTAAAVAACVFGGAELVRVHDVAEGREVLAVSAAIAAAREATR